jgi:branched-chain amino acid transport system substrate-binding protein
MDIHVRKVERVGGKLVNSVVKTYPGVSQFWTYNTKDFLSKPVYARDYPQAINLEK